MDFSLKHYVCVCVSIFQFVLKWIHPCLPMIFFLQFSTVWLVQCLWCAVSWAQLFFLTNLFCFKVCVYVHMNACACWGQKEGIRFPRSGAPSVNNYLAISPVCELSFYCMRVKGSCLSDFHIQSRYISKITQLWACPDTIMEPTPYNCYSSHGVESYHPADSCLDFLIVLHVSHRLSIIQSTWDGKCFVSVLLHVLEYAKWCNLDIRLNSKQESHIFLMHTLITCTEDMFIFYIK